MGFNLPIVYSSNQVVVVMAGFAEGSGKIRFAPLQKVFSRPDTKFFHFLLCRMSYAVKFADRQGAQKCFGFFRENDGQSIGFVEVGGDFCQKFVVGNAGRCHKVEPSAYFMFDLFGDERGGGRACKRMCDVQVGFVEGEWFDKIGVLIKNSADLLRNLFVYVKPGLHKDCMGTLFDGTDGWHGRADSIFACFVAGSCNDSPPLRRPSDDNRFVPVGWFVPLLHRSIERIHIDVNDFAHGGASNCSVLRVFFENENLYL